MKAFLVSGSPRKGENSEKILDYAKSLFEKEGWNTESVKLSGKEVKPCIACYLCKKEYRCSQKDGLSDILKKSVDCDAIILISPTYMGGMTSQMKAFIDRSSMLRRNDFKLKGKVGAAISVGASRNGGQEHTISQIHQAFFIHGMIVVGDNSHFGGIVEAPFEEDEDGKETVEDTVKSVIEACSR